MKYFLGVIFFIANLILWYVIAPQIQPNGMIVMNAPAMFQASSCFIVSIVCFMSAWSDTKIKNLLKQRDNIQNEGNFQVNVKKQTKSDESLSQEKLKNQTFNIGEKVLFDNIQLTIASINEDGSYACELDGIHFADLESYDIKKLNYENRDF